MAPDGSRRNEAMDFIWFILKHSPFSLRPVGGDPIIDYRIYFV